MARGRACAQDSAVCPGRCGLVDLAVRLAMGACPALRLRDPVAEK